MSLSTSVLADVGVYSVNLTVSLTNFPLVASITKTVVITITCEVQTLTFSTSPAASTKLKVGIDSQPIDIVFATI